MYEEYPRDRATAKATGAKFYYTGQPCKHGHVCLRKTKGSCVECVKEEFVKYAPRRAAYFEEYRNRPENKERQRQWYLDNRELTIARSSARPKDKTREYKRAWKASNPDRLNADTAKRRAQKHSATPTWLTQEHHEQMQALYAEALKLAAQTGVEHQVDHIYPLRSDVVCGLHVPWNLRVVTSSENQSKSNRLPDPSEALAYPDGYYK